MRAVWGYPATITFGEAVFVVPLIKAYNKHRYLAYQYDMFNGGFAKIRRRMAGYPLYVGLDFSKFEKTLPSWLIRKAFKI